MSPRDGDRDSDSDGDGNLRRSVAPPRYVGHDARPTSPKELLGWYMYAFAAETYVICGIGTCPEVAALFASWHSPVLKLLPGACPVAKLTPYLQAPLSPSFWNLSHGENGVLLADPSKPCGSSDSKGEDDGQCVVYILGLEINTASFAMYTFSVSVLVQALLVVSISCAADHGNFRKQLLLTFAWIGSFCRHGLHLRQQRDIYPRRHSNHNLKHVVWRLPLSCSTRFSPSLVRKPSRGVGGPWTPDPRPGRLRPRITSAGGVQRRARSVHGQFYVRLAG